MYVAKASVSAYLLGEMLLKIGVKCNFQPKKHDQFWSSFLFPFSFLPQNG